VKEREDLVKRIRGERVESGRVGTKEVAKKVEIEGREKKEDTLVGTKSLDRSKKKIEEDDYDPFAQFSWIDNEKRKTNPFFKLTGREEAKLKRDRASNFIGRRVPSNSILEIKTGVTYQQEVQSRQNTQALKDKVHQRLYEIQANTLKEPLVSNRSIKVLKKSRKTKSEVSCGVSFKKQLGRGEGTPELISSPFRDIMCSKLFASEKPFSFRQINSTSKVLPVNSRSGGSSKNIQPITSSRYIPDSLRTIEPCPSLSSHTQPKNPETPLRPSPITKPLLLKSLQKSVRTRAPPVYTSSSYNPSFQSVKERTDIGCYSFAKNTGRTPSVLASALKLALEKTGSRPSYSIQFQPVKLSRQVVNPPTSPVRARPNPTPVPEEAPHQTTEAADPIIIHNTALFKLSTSKDSTHATNHLQISKQASKLPSHMSKGSSSRLSLANQMQSSLESNCRLGRVDVGRGNRVKGGSVKYPFDMLEVIRNKRKTACLQKVEPFVYSSDEDEEYLEAGVIKNC